MALINSNLSTGLVLEIGEGMAFTVPIHEGEIILNGTPEEVFSNVSLIKELGLRTPQVTEYAQRLEQEGILQFGGQYPVTIEQAKAAVGKLFGRGAS